MPKPTLPPALRFSLFGLGVFLVLGILTLGGVAYAYRGKYYPGVRVGTLDLAGKSKTDGEQLVAEQVKLYEAHQVVVTVPDLTKPRDEATNEYPDIEVPTTARNLGIAFTAADSLHNAWQVGHSRNLLKWVADAFQSFFNGSRQPLVYSVDQTQVAAFINTQVVPKIITPTPAKIVISKSDISIEDPKQGLDINQIQLAKDLAASLASATDNDTTYLRAPVELTDSPITKAAVQPVVDQLNTLGNMKVTLATSDGSVTLHPTREQLLSWFIPLQDDTGAISLSLNEDGISSYLQKNSRNLLNQKDSLAAIIKSLGSALTTPPKSVSVALASKPAPAAHFALADFTGKYIEVDLKNQRMFLINNKAVEKTYVVSSGKWSTPTPTGTFHIASKVSVAYSKSFGLYMPYWQNFMDDAGVVAPVGQFGIHGLPYWPNGYKEGQNHLGVPVSHGCVRLGESSDVEVYNWTSIGTPVVIY